jgi:hypothetical protein
MAKLKVGSVPPVGPTVPPELPDELELLDELALELLDELAPEVHEQGEDASATHCAFQLVVQQYGSDAQTVVTHAWHDDTSLAPLAQGEWLHVPPPDELVAPDVLVPTDELVELVLDVAGGPPQTLVLGRQSRRFFPSAPATGVQVRPDAHAVVSQLGAQYWSPPNWPH